MKIVSVFSFSVQVCLLLAVVAARETEKVSRMDPIIIKTPERNYDEPSLDDYTQCSNERNLCLNSCDSHDYTCQDKCPKCPILVAHENVVQGINDTEHRIPSSKPVNSTTVIRLRNEIRNVIENNMGDIIARNENNVKIHQKNSTVGGDYGLGYDETGSCCTVVSKHRSRQRLCGARCKSRVMYARPVVQCANEMDLDSCTQSMEYKPYQPRRQRHYSSGSNCRYQSEWPFVSCRSRRQNRACSPMCLELAYGYILQHGVPLHCISCFKNFHKFSSDIPSMGYAPDNDFGLDDDGWTLEKTKCRRADGTISEDCNNDMGSGDNEVNYDPDSYQYDQYSEIDGSRFPRNTFRRSKYALRHKRKDNQAADEQN